ncbi:DUF4232 domain-containing protein [Streptomyces botrytidirepellens]|uniref:DUF4232 domain-containing protein n=1 Tax=Streptomyces botrytidirepellens TaxID=2486417 RepID=A0A3M8WGC9_9ACTN|nr:DUF4232 domain-containing protein [Streptomyces botrytidirepellens]RNG27013.1 DUF4232 domain-containing protein [Streptomyces botrytidirepellens]
MNATTTARTARRRTLRVAAATLTAAAALTLTACNGSDTAGAKTSGKADSAAAADREGAGSSEVQGSESQADAGTKAGAAGKQSAPRCHTDGLKAAFATGEDAVPDPNAEGSTTTSIVLTNTTGTSCKIGGFPGVDLNTEHGSGDWSLQRSSAKFSSITLGPGDSTDFTINLALAGEDDEDSWTPAYAVITPPNETKSITLDWPWGGLVDQRSATHPATFVNPIG